MSVAEMHYTFVCQPLLNATTEKDDDDEEAKKACALGTVGGGVCSS